MGIYSILENQHVKARIANPFIAPWLGGAASWEEAFEALPATWWAMFEGVLGFAADEAQFSQDTSGVIFEENLLNKLENASSALDASAQKFYTEYNNLRTTEITKANSIRAKMDSEKLRLYSQLYSYLTYVKFFVLIILIIFLHMRNYDITIIEYIILIVFVCYLIYVYYRPIINVIRDSISYILANIYHIERYIL